MVFENTSITMVGESFVNLMLSAFAVAAILIPLSIVAYLLYRGFAYKHRCIIHWPNGKTIFTGAKITKGKMTLKKPRYRINTFDLTRTTLDHKGRYVFHFYRENENSYRQVMPLFRNITNDELVHIAEDKGIEYIAEEWKKQQRSVFSMEGFAQYKDFAFLGLIIVFQIVGMSLLFKAAGME